MNDLDKTGAFQPDGNEAPGVDTVASQPKQIGRYRVERIIGKGGFGLVYLAYDDQLSRPVAIKVLHRKVVDRPKAAQAYLTEARTVANLDHPNIVPVHDVGSTDHFPCYVVSKYIDGTDLASRLSQSRLNLHETLELVATVAEALHYAHKQGLVHRDVKPGNILLDKSGKAFVADFGLALRERDSGKGPRYAGTPAYMSPEQARGEGHRVDARSDIFSLGVVFYELLVGHKPFRADSQSELLEQITSYEPRPPRQYDDHIPKEVDRICLKTLSKRASERYSTARDMADDLRHFLAEQTVNQQSSLVEKGSGSPAITPVLQPPSTVGGSGTSVTPTTSTPTSDHQLIKIVPKGLRSYDAHDSDFFLELLPGPRDRDGLPESIRFWKTRIEEKDADNTFSVGLIYGPSGCGKSSLVKAGLLPRLSNDMIAVYVEATAEETETRLLNGLRKRCPALTDSLSLKESLAALRRGQGIPLGKKIVIVLDQFEQWLHAKKDEQNTELVQSLRQCDGGRVQCIVMVRDDFWMAATRFMRQLDIRLLEGQNSASVDLFDLDHARKVLAAFGRAFGKLPELGRDKSKDQKEFLNLSVSGLAQEGKVICVRLALFAEMMKGKVWTPTTLKEVGGTEGVGLTFLEETFSAATAPPEHRYHQKAARAVLKALLPESGTDIKGHMRSYAELLEASGYGNRPNDFDDLIRILDGEIRLITPTDLEGKEEISNAVLNAGMRYYQLTHDYLVHSLRDWLTQKQKETRRGRAELLLTDRAAVWNARPENRQLPSLLQWLNIRLWTPNKNWTLPQKKMMVKAARYHAVRGALLASFLILLVLVGGESFGRLKAQVLRDRLLESTTADVPGIIKEMASYRRWITPLLQDAYAHAKQENDSRKQLHVSLALLPLDVAQIEYLSERLLRSEPHEVPVICDALAPYKDALKDKLWVIVEKPEKGKESERLRAASALATFDPHNERWGKTSNHVVDDLVQENPVLLGLWSQIFRPIKNGLLPRLSEIFRDYQPEHTAERSLATNLIADYTANQIEVLGDFLMDADEKQFVVIYPKLKEQRERALTLLTGEIDKTVRPELPSTDDSREKLAKRQANAAVALLRMNHPEKVWPLLKHSPDPRVRSYLIHRLAPMGADSRIIAKHLTEESDITIRRVLLLCLGEFSEKDFSLDDRNELLPLLQEIYQSDSDPGIHAASDWLLRQWGVTLPDLPLGEPALTDEQKLRIAQRNTEIVGIRRNIAATQVEWERQLREQPMKLNPSVSNGLVAHYSFDEVTGTVSANSVQGQPAGLFAGMSEPEWLPGVVGNAVRLNGNGGHFSFGNDFTPQHTDAFSYGCWLFAEMERINSSLIAKMDLEKNYRGFDITTESDGTIGCNLVHSFPDNFVKVTTVERFAARRWHHFFVSYDGSSSAGGLKLYVDGHSLPLITWSDRLSDTIQTSVPLQIGQRGNSFGFRGVIDDVRIYNRCVSDHDVRLFYESGLHTLTHIPDDVRTPEQQALLVMECRLQSVPLQRLEAQLVAAQSALRDARWENVRRWYVNNQGQTMAVIPGPVEFMMGSSPTEVDHLTEEVQHKRRIGRTFAIGWTCVTRQQHHSLTNNKLEIGDKFDRYPDLPVVGISWYEAAAYCNLLSKAEGIREDQWCYETDSSGTPTLKSEYLSLTGYRLPTEAEVEFAIRAGSVTSRCYGETDELLPYYAWYMKNSGDSLQRVGTKKPNDFGLFDMNGNCSTWCQGPLQVYPKNDGNDAVEDAEPKQLEIKSTNDHVLRGGWYFAPASNLRSSYRYHSPPSVRLFGNGFRVARTIRVE